MNTHQVNEREPRRTSDHHPTELASRILEPAGRRERDGGKAQPVAGRDLLLARTPDVGVRKENQATALAVQAG